MGFPFTLDPETYSLCRLMPDELAAALPFQDGFWSLTVSVEEISLICVTAKAGKFSQRSDHWRALKLAGPLPLSMKGVLVSFLKPLADIGVSILAIATFDTDYVFVQNQDLPGSLQALREAGHDFRD